MKHLFFLVGLLCLTAAPISSFAQAQNAKDLPQFGIRNSA